MYACVIFIQNTIQTLLFVCVCGFERRRMPLIIMWSNKNSDILKY